MTDEAPDAEDQEAAPQEPSPASLALLHGLYRAISMVPVGGLILFISANIFLYGWLGIVPKMTYGQACAGMALLWLIRFFMYR